jgi:ribosomal protein L37AE/L43A
MIPLCRTCGDEMFVERAALGYRTCLPCGDQEAKEARSSWTVVPMPKSNYILVTDPTLLKGLNSSHRGNR